MVGNWRADYDRAILDIKVALQALECRLLLDGKYEHVFLLQCAGREPCVAFIKLGSTGYWSMAADWYEAFNQFPRIAIFLTGPTRGYIVRAPQLGRMVEERVPQGPTNQYRLAERDLRGCDHFGTAQECGAALGRIAQLTQ